MMVLKLYGGFHVGKLKLKFLLASIKERRSFQNFSIYTWKQENRDKIVLIIFYHYLFMQQQRKIGKL
jgi:hypothetical protein